MGAQHLKRHDEEEIRPAVQHRVEAEGALHDRGAHLVRVEPAEGAGRGGLDRPELPVACLEHRGGGKPGGRIDARIRMPFLEHFLEAPAPEERLADRDQGALRLVRAGGHDADGRAKEAVGHLVPVVGAVGRSLAAHEAVEEGGQVASEPRRAGAVPADGVQRVETCARDPRDAEGVEDVDLLSALAPVPGAGPRGLALDVEDRHRPLPVEDRRDDRAGPLARPGSGEDEVMSARQARPLVRCIAQGPGAMVSEWQAAARAAEVLDRAWAYPGPGAGVVPGVRVRRVRAG